MILNGSVFFLLRWGCEKVNVLGRDATLSNFPNNQLDASLIPVSGMLKTPTATEKSVTQRSNNEKRVQTISTPPLWCAD